MRLLDGLTGLEPIAKDCRAHAISQGRRLQLAALATEQVTQDLAKDVSHRCLGLTSRSGLSRNADLDGTNNDRLEAPLFNRLCKLAHDLGEDVSARDTLTTGVRRSRALLAARRNLIAGSRPKLIAQAAVLLRCGLRSRGSGSGLRRPLSKDLPQYVAESTA